MPKATMKSKHNHPDETTSSFDIALQNFRESGHFILSNEILTTQRLADFTECLKARDNSFPEAHYKLSLSYVTFKLDLPNSYTQEDSGEAVLWQLQQLFSFSPKWHVIALDNVAIWQGEHRYSLSSYFIDGLLAQLDRIKDYLTELSITKAEFPACGWMRFLTIPPKLDILTLELPNDDEDNADNLIVLCEALQYAKIKSLNLADTEIDVEGYQALNTLLDKNYFIEKMLLKEPTDPESQVIFKKMNQRLVEGRTGQQRFDLEKFNQAEFLRLILKAQNALTHETDETAIRRLKREITFLLEKKIPFSISMDNRKNWLSFAPEVHVVYFDHAEYIEERLDLFRLDLNLLVNNGTRTLGHCLLENALMREDSFMLNCLIKAGANLFEQQGNEKPFLIQIFEKNTDFKVLILNHIAYDKTLPRTAERVLQHYSKSKDIMLELGWSLIKYAEILKKRTYPIMLSDFERLLNLLKDVLRLPRPSKKREKEFIDIYCNLFKCLIMFHDARGKVTTESISHVQKMLSEIGAISKDADWGWKYGSELHRGLRGRLGPLRENMQEIKKLAEKDDMICEKDVVIQQKDNIIKNLSEKCEYLEATIQQNQENAEVERQQFKAELAAMQTRLEALTKDSETSTLDEPGPSTRFFPRR
jgi:gas vesicle protein